MDIPNEKRIDHLPVEIILENFWSVKRDANINKQEA